MTILSQAPKIRIVKWLFWAEGWTPSPRHIFISHRAVPTHALLQHELVHAAQMQAHGWLSWAARYIFCRKWRLAYELEAYITSMEHGADPAACARYLATWWRYWLFMRAAAVEARLTDAFAQRQELRTKTVCVAELLLERET
jgi:hypothetical protein